MNISLKKIKLLKMSGHYRLKNLGNRVFQIHQKGGPAFEGDTNSIFVKAVQLGIQLKFLIVATNELFKCGHDYADFDRSGTLLYTRKEKW